MGFSKVYERSAGKKENLFFFGERKKNNKNKGGKRENME